MRFIDIDKVKKDLDKNKPDWTAEDYAVACEDAEFYSTIKDFMAEHEEDIEMVMFAPELVPDEPSWISCSERLPESEREVLVYVKGDFDNSIPFITTAYINSDHDWQSDYDGEVIDSKISHWMPLPKPPESEVQNG